MSDGGNEAEWMARSKANASCHTVAELAFHKRLDANLAAGHVCGNCTMFVNEDASGVGWCEAHMTQSVCDVTCLSWAPALRPAEKEKGE